MSKITGLTQDTAPSATDLVYTVKDPGGTPLDRKVEIKDLGTDYYDNGSKGVADSPYSLDLDNGHSQKITITGNITLDIINGVSGADHPLKLIIVNGGASTITWDMGLVTSGGTAFSLTAAGTDVIELDSVDAFTNTFGFQAGEDMQ
jgi:hypothetical protein